jgi:hypothetical protein
MLHATATSDIDGRDMRKQEANLLNGVIVKSLLGIETAQQRAHLLIRGSWSYSGFPKFCNGFLAGASHVLEVCHACRKK